MSRPLRTSGRWAGRALLVFLLGGAAACGGGGGGTPTRPPPPAGITFTPSGASGANSLALRRSPSSTNTVLALELVATDVDDLFGLSFDLDYPANLLDFESSDEGSFLSTSGTVATTLQVAESGSGTLVVGQSRLGAVGGVSGSGVLLVLQFRGVGNGSGMLAFDRNEAFDPRGATQPVAWGGGSVQVNL